MNNHFKLGKPLNVIWHFKRPDGKNYSLAGLQHELVCYNSRGRFKIKDSVINVEDTGILSFTLKEEKQTVEGAYSFYLTLLRHGKTVNTIVKNDAIILSKHIIDTDSIQEDEPTTINIFSVGEFELFRPTAPVAGSDGWWYFDGQPILDDEGNKVPINVTIDIIDDPEDQDFGLIILDKSRDGDRERVIYGLRDTIKKVVEQGNTTEAQGIDAERQGNVAESQGNVAESQGNVAEAQGLTAKAQGEKAEQQGNIAEQKGSYAAQLGNTAEAQGNTAKQRGEKAEQQGNTAEAQGNTAEQQGLTAKAQGDKAEAQGNTTEEQGDQAVQIATDKGNEAIGIAQTAANTANTAANNANTAAQEARDGIAEMVTAVENAKDDIIKEVEEGKLAELEQKLSQSDSMMFDRLSLGNQYESYYWGVINGTGIWVNINSNYQHRLFPVKLGDTIILTAGDNAGNYAFLHTVPFPKQGESADFISGIGRTNVARNTTVTVTAPADGYLYVSYIYSGSSTAFASIIINNVDVVKKWDDIVKEAVKVPTIENHLSVIDSEIDAIGVFRMQESGTPKGTTVAAPAQAGKKYKLGIKVDSGSLGANFVAYNGNTAFQQVSNITDGIEITVASNATSTAIYFQSSNTGVNPQITFTDVSGIISKIERKVEEKADTAVVEEQLDDIYEGLKRYNVKVSDGTSVDVPITKVPNGIYQVDISVVSGTLIGKLNGYDATNNVLFSYTLQEYTKKAIPECDHMKVYLGSQNTATGAVLIFTSFGSVLKNSNQIHQVPKYVFTIDNEVRTPVIVYQEGIDKKTSDKTLNGGIGIVLNPKDGSGQRQLRIESKNNYEEYNINQIAASATKNVRDVRILSLGDSITWNNTKNPLTNEYDKWRNWVSYMTYLSLIHNKDNNCGVITQLGTRYHNVGFDYKEEHFYQKVFLEATTGWSAADYLYHPFQMKLIGASATIFGTPEVWYAKGLATKTPYDADSYNVDYEDWNGSDEQQALLQSTPMGRYKIDHVQSIWDKIKIIDTTFHPGESWTGSAQQKSDIDAWMLSKMENPENHFYSLEQARAYTGSYIWTYDYAISIEKYLERYRTMDNNGNRLYFDAHGSTTGIAGSSNIGYLADGTPTAYYLGTEVSDTMAYNVCKPTHVIVNLGTNGGYSQPSMDNLDDILAYMKSKINHVGYMIPRFDNGVFNIGRWKGVVPHEITENMYNFEINKYMMSKYAGNINDGTKVQYIPAYAVQCPYSSILDTYAINDFCEKTYCQSKADGHIGWLANRDVGLQAYGWLLNSVSL